MTEISRCVSLGGRGLLSGAMGIPKRVIAAFFSFERLSRVNLLNNRWSVVPLVVLATVMSMPMASADTLIQDPSFEGRGAGWTVSTTTKTPRSQIINNRSGYFACHGAYKAEMGGYGFPSVDLLSQRFKVHNLAQAELSFCLNIPRTTAGARFVTIEVEGDDGVRRTVGYYTNKDWTSGYSKLRLKLPVEMTYKRDQSVRVSFKVVSTSRTPVLIDNVTLLT